MPNLNAALGCAQMEQLKSFLMIKRSIADEYRVFCGSEGLRYIDEPENSVSNFWLNTIVLEDLKERDEFLRFTNEKGVMTRPVWTLMNELPMYRQCGTGSLDTSKWYTDRIVNLPSSVPFKRMEIRG